ncbi:hypothetical protein A6U87_26085 [Rhizobium sp. AC44/96]|uniref:ABC transporter substrate-binding protein n=1 Tax=Rhizobium sp. AC44/96 TaxID=1841654 RepID=UPI00080F8EA9|nr:ABC transporter substrate-binding protein [Rhizobium sp. AC44/96]OCJ14427.1 hypothetical protein A6U87_26085 [Rhizobium sp. AC44/96]
MIRTTILSTLAGLLLSGSAMAQSAPKVEVLHWLTAGAESAAIKVLADDVNKRGGQWVDLSTPGGGSAARTMLATGLAGGTPPGVAFLAMGPEAAELGAQGVMRDVGQYAKEKGYLASVPDYAMAMGRGGDGAVYALPVAFETQNFMWYSKPIFQKVGIEPPKSWDEFLAQADKIKQAGFIPLAVGEQGWQVILIFNSVVLGEGVDYYDDLFVKRTAEARQSDKLVKAFTTFRALSTMSDDGAPNRLWNDTLNLVANGRAAIQIMGSWAGAELDKSGKVYGTDWGCALSPGQPLAIVGATGFEFPKLSAAGGEAGQNIFIDSMMDPAVQAAFSVQKGSIPARTDADTSSLSECSKIAVGAIKDGKGVPYIAGVLPTELRGQLQDFLADFWANKSVTPEDAAKAYAQLLDSEN